MLFANPSFANTQADTGRVQKARFVQIYFEGAPYLHSGIRYGAGNLFAKVNGPVTGNLHDIFSRCDTLFVIPDLAYEGLFHKYIIPPTPAADYALQAETYRNAVLLRGLNRHSLDRVKITAVTYRLVELAYRISATRIAEHVFPNYAIKRPNGGLWVFRQVVVADIVPPL